MLWQVPTNAESATFADDNDTENSTDGPNSTIQPESEVVTLNITRILLVIKSPLDDFPDDLFTGNARNDHTTTNFTFILKTHHFR